MYDSFQLPHVKDKVRSLVRLIKVWRLKHKWDIVNGMPHKLFLELLLIKVALKVEQAQLREPQARDIKESFLNDVLESFWFQCAADSEEYVPITREPLTKLFNPEELQQIAKTYCKAPHLFLEECRKSMRV